MRLNTLVAILGSLAMAGLANAGDKTKELQLGDNIPKADVEMKNVDGKKLSINDVKGEKGTLIIFSCNHCPFVKAWQDRIVDIGNTYKKKGLGVILVNANDPEKYKADSFANMKKLAKKKGYNFPYVVDATSNVARAFDASRTPEAFLFNADDKLVYHGAIDDNPHKPKKVKKRYLRQALEALVAGEEIEKKQTKSVGCSIKFR